MNNIPASLISIAVLVSRVGAAFFMVPVLDRALVPPLVRNSAFVAVAVCVVALQGNPLEIVNVGSDWVVLLIREVFIGTCIGFLFGGAVWACASAGEILDRKIGPVFGSVSDPFSGEEGSVNGLMFARLGTFFFVMSGGLSLLVGALLESYSLFPIGAANRALAPDGADLFIHRFGMIFASGVGLAAPALVTLTAVEFGSGLISRFAPSLNVFSLSMALKSWLSCFLVLGIAEAAIRLIEAQSTDAVRTIGVLFQSIRGPGSP